MPGLEQSRSVPGDVGGSPSSNVEPKGLAPVASVIIAAHDRKEYLVKAVQSVLGQDVDRRCFEVIVVTNFEDELVDRFLAQAGVRKVRCDDRPVGRKVATALRECQGRVILLLDDDDLFEPTKVRTVLSRFGSDESLGLYHNRFRYIDADGRPLSVRAIRPFGLRPLNRSRKIYLGPAAKDRELHRLAYCYADFNISSFAFRRELVSESFSYLDRLDGALDTFLFFQALLSPYSVLIDDAILTQYRVHQKNTTLAGVGDGRSQRLRLLGAANMLDRSYALINEMMLLSHQISFVRQIEARRVVNRLTRVFRDSESQRADAAKVLIEALRLGDTYAVRENVASWAGALLFLISPGLARRVYDHQMSL